MLASLQSVNLTTASQVVNVLQQITAVNVTTPQGLQLMASGVMQALSNPLQVNADAIATALGILSDVASGSASGAVNVTLDAALSVTQALSSIVIASSNNAGTVAKLTVLQQVLDVVNSLSQSMLSSAVPNDPPVGVNLSDSRLAMQAGIVLELTASSVAQALSNSSQVNAEAIATSLGILSDVASGSATGDVSVTLEAALSVTAALSSIVVASRDNNVAAGANLVVLQQVLQVVGNLTQSLLSSAALSSSSDNGFALQVNTVLQLTATGVAQAVSNSSQVNASAFTSALGILSVVASGSALGTVNLTLDTALSVTEALSFIVVASSNSTGADLAVLQQVVHVVDNLTQSLLSSAAPNDPPLYINSSDIQMALQVPLRPRRSPAPRPRPSQRSSAR